MSRQVSKRMRVDPEQMVNSTIARIETELEKYVFFVLGTNLRLPTSQQDPNLKIIKKYLFQTLYFTSRSIINEKCFFREKIQTLFDGYLLHELTAAFNPNSQDFLFPNVEDFANFSELYRKFLLQFMDNLLVFASILDNYKADCKLMALIEAVSLTICLRAPELKDQILERCGQMIKMVDARCRYVAKLNFSGTRVIEKGDTSLESVCGNILTNAVKSQESDWSSSSVVDEFILLARVKLHSKNRMASFLRALLTVHCTFQTSLDSLNRLWVLPGSMYVPISHFLAHQLPKVVAGSDMFPLLHRLLLDLANEAPDDKDIPFDDLLLAVKAIADWMGRTDIRKVLNHFYQENSSLIRRILSIGDVRWQPLQAQLVSFIEHGLECVENVVEFEESAAMFFSMLWTIHCDPSTDLTMLGHVTEKIFRKIVDEFSHNLPGLVINPIVSSIGYELARIKKNDADKARWSFLLINGIILQSVASKVWNSKNSLTPELSQALATFIRTCDDVGSKLYRTWNGLWPWTPILKQLEKLDSSLDLKLFYQKKFKLPSVVKEFSRALSTMEKGPFEAVHYIVNELQKENQKEFFKKLGSIYPVTAMQMLQIPTHANGKHKEYGFFVIDQPKQNNQGFTVLPKGQPEPVRRLVELCFLSHGYVLILKDQLKSYAFQIEQVCKQLIDGPILKGDEGLTIAYYILNVLVNQGAFKSDLPLKVLAKLDIDWQQIRKFLFAHYSQIRLLELGKLALCLAKNDSSILTKAVCYIAEQATIGEHHEEAISALHVVSVDQYFSIFHEETIACAIHGALVTATSNLSSDIPVAKLFKELLTVFQFESYDDLFEDDSVDIPTRLGERLLAKALLAEADGLIQYYQTVITVQPAKFARLIISPGFRCILVGYSTPEVDHNKVYNDFVTSLLGSKAILNKPKVITQAIVNEIADFVLYNALVEHKSEQVTDHIERFDRKLPEAKLKTTMNEVKFLFRNFQTICLGYAKEPATLSRSLERNFAKLTASSPQVEYILSLNSIKLLIILKTLRVEDKLRYYYMLKRYVFMMIGYDFLRPIGISIWEEMVEQSPTEKQALELRPDLMTPLSEFSHQLKVGNLSTKMKAKFKEKIINLLKLRASDEPENRHVYVLESGVTNSDLRRQGVPSISCPILTPDTPALMYSNHRDRSKIKAVYNTAIDHLPTGPNTPTSILSQCFALNQLTRLLRINDERFIIFNTFKKATDKLLYRTGFCDLTNKKVRCALSQLSPYLIGVAKWNQSQATQASNLFEPQKPGFAETFRREDMVKFRAIYVKLLAKVNSGISTTEYTILGHAWPKVEETLIELNRGNCDFPEISGLSDARKIAANVSKNMNVTQRVNKNSEMDESSPNDSRKRWKRLK